MNYVELLKNIQPVAVDEIEVGGEIVEFKVKISQLDKYSIIRVAVDSAFDTSTGMYDVMYADVLFEMLLMQAYTNIEFEDEKLVGTELFMLYEAFKSLGVFEIIHNIDVSDYEDIIKMKDAYVEMKFKQQSSFALLADTLSFGNLDDLDNLNSEETQKSIKNLVDVTKPLVALDTK